MIYNNIKITTTMSEENKSLFITSFKNTKRETGVCYGAYFDEDPCMVGLFATSKHIAFAITDIYVLDDEMFMDIKILSTFNGKKLKERLLGKHEFGVDLHTATYAQITVDKQDISTVSKFISINISETYVETDTTCGVVATTSTTSQDHYELKESELNNVAFDPFESTDDLDIKALDFLQMKLNLVDTMYNAFKREDDKPYFHLDFLLQKYLGMSQADIDKMKNTEK